jgi:FdhD protein
MRMSEKKIAGIHSLAYTAFENGVWQPVAGAITEEALVCIHLNGRELATFMCTPHEQDELALGFLRAEGLLHSLDEVQALTVAENGHCVDVWLDHPVEIPARRIVTSGCGGGVTFDDLRTRQAPLNTRTTITPDQVFARMRDLYQAGSLYRTTQGIHTSALSDGERLLLAAEDVGRHNTIDRLWGKALKQNLATEGLILIATGRISSEMLGKAAKMGVPIVISRTSATSMSVTLADAWNITVVGYVRRNSLRVYTAPHRIAAAAPATASHA